MSTARLMSSSPDAAVAADASHVFGAAHAVEPGAVRLAAVIDPAFLVEAGWDRTVRVLSLPAGHPLLGWRACEAPGCTSQVYGQARTCGRCRIDAEPHGRDRGRRAARAGAALSG